MLVVDSLNLQADHSIVQTEEFHHITSLYQVQPMGKCLWNTEHYGDKQVLLFYGCSTDYTITSRYLA
jgi:hypothetical protein